MQSVYIPHIPVAYTSEMVTFIFDQFAIGQVSRVDFLAPHETKPRIRQAFVHFNAYRNGITSSMVLKHAINQPYRLVVDNEGHYWDLCENKKPVPETHLNINQLAENMRILQASFESKIAELTEKLAVIPQMQEEIATLKTRILYLEDPEWLMSTGTGFDNGPLTTSMLNDDIDDDDAVADDDDEEYDASAAIHPCNASEYAAALHPCDIAFCQDDDYEYDNHDLCDDSFSDDITACTPLYSMVMNPENAGANFRAEIEHHFVNERTRVAPPLVRTKSVHCYDEAVDVDDNDDDGVPTANDEEPFVSIGFADDGRIYVEYEQE